MPFDLPTYLSRIAAAEIDPTADGLKTLQFNQLRSIAFENIEPLLGHVPDLSPDAVWRKLVIAGRGGYCFELNGLLGRALAAAGFACRPVLGRVRMGAPTGGPRAHLAFVVTLDGEEWLVDAGFGGPGPAEPLRIGSRDEQMIRGVRFRIRAEPASGEDVVERATDAGWFALYGFDRTPVADADIEAANFLCARWDQAPFPHNLMINRVTNDGRKSLFNTGLRREHGLAVDETAIGSAAELHACLADDFGLRLGFDVAEAVWARLAAGQAQAAE